jgi:hypothetical protein
VLFAISLEKSFDRIKKRCSALCLSDENSDRNYVVVPFRAITTLHD